MEMNKTGTNKLAERILTDARSAAEQTLSEANATAMTLSADNVQKLNAMRQDFEQDARFDRRQKSGFGKKTCVDRRRICKEL